MPPDITLRTIGDAASVHAARDAAVNQRDNLCGCFWGWVALRAFDHSTLHDEEEVAVHAAAVVPDGETDPVFSLPWRGDGVTASWPYRLSLPSSPDDAAIGTSARGVGVAVEALSEGRLTAVPFRHEQWTSEVVDRTIDALAALGPLPMLPVVNIATRHLAGSRRTAAEVYAHLAGGTPLPRREPDWDVGHFATLAGTLSGPGGQLVLIRDTYRAMGWRGHHVQTSSAVAAALHRGGAEAGGLLMLAHTGAASEVSDALASVGLISEWWSNGSPEPG